MAERTKRGDEQRKQEDVGAPESGADFTHQPPAGGADPTQTTRDRGIDPAGDPARHADRDENR
jgi:hypothetical protein